VTQLMVLATFLAFAVAAVKTSLRSPAPAAYA
jgi:hypothetical protein